MTKKIFYSAVIASLVLGSGVLYAEETTTEASATGTGGTSANTLGLPEVSPSTEKPKDRPRAPVIQMFKNRDMQATPAMKRPDDGMRNSSSTNTKEDMRRKMEDKRMVMASSTDRTSKEEFRKEIEDKIKKQKEEMGKRKVHQFTNIIERFNKTITRLSDILARLETRVAKIKAEGGNTTTTDEYIVKTHTDLDLAKTSYLSLSTLLDGVGSTNTDKSKIASSTLSELRKLSEETGKHIRNAQKDMENAISNLKGPNATTTKINNNR